MMKNKTLNFVAYSAIFLHLVVINFLPLAGKSSPENQGAFFIKVDTKNISKNIKKGSFHILTLSVVDDRLNRIFSSCEYVTPVVLAMADHCTTSDLEKMIGVITQRDRQESMGTE